MTENNKVTLPSGVSSEEFMKSYIKWEIQRGESKEEVEELTEEFEDEGEGEGPSEFQEGGGLRC